MSGGQTLVKQLRVDELIKKWGSDPLNWGVRDTSALLKMDPNDWSQRLIASLHRLAKRTRTLADRDFVTSKLLTQVTDRITDALFEPPAAPLDKDDLLPSDVNHVYNKLQKTFDAVDALHEASGDFTFRFFSNNKHMPAASPLAWEMGFINHFTALIKAHPNLKRHRILFTEVFPRAISSRLRLEPDSPKFLTITDLMSVPDIYAKVIKEMPELEQEESEEGEEENKEEKAEENMYPSAPRYKTAYGKMLGERLDKLELGFEDVRKNLEEAKKEIRGR